MTPEQRLAAVFELCEVAGQLNRDGIRRRHPDYDESLVGDALARMRLGDALFREAFPSRRVVDP
jgi:hypothetical protein